MPAYKLNPETTAASATGTLQSWNHRFAESNHAFSEGAAQTPGRAGHTEWFARAFLDALSVSVCVLDETGTILVANKAWCNFISAHATIPSSLVEGANYLAACETAASAGVAAAGTFAKGLRAVLQGIEDEFALDYPAHSQAGKRWFIGRVTRFQCQGLTRVVVAQEDITAWKLSEEALREQRERVQAFSKISRELLLTEDLNEGQEELRIMLELAGSAYAQVETESGRLLRVNRKLCEITGYSAAELLEKTLWQIVHPEDGCLDQPDLPRLVKNDVGEMCSQKRLLHKDGRVIWTQLTTTRIRDAHGRLSRAVVVIQDITERKQSEQQVARLNRELLRRMSELQTLINAAPMEIWVAHDPECRSVTGNKYAYELRGIPQGSNVSQSVQSKSRLAYRICRAGQEIPPDQLPLQSVTAQGEPLLNSEFELRWKSGRVNHMVGNTVPLFDEAGKVRGAIAAFADITEQKRAEEFLRRAHADVELLVQERTADLKNANAELLGQMAARKRLEKELLEITDNERRHLGIDLHDELGQQLTGLAFMAKGLELKLRARKVSEASDAAKLHVLIAKALNDTRALAKDLATMEFEESDLPAVLKNMAAHVKSLFKVSCSFKVKGTTPRLEPIVARQLFNIAQEAATNAIKHGKARHIWLALTHASGRLLLEIKNDGQPFVGVAARHQGMGLRNMHYRAGLIGASLEIKSSAESHTVVSCALPLDKNGGEAGLL